MPKNKRMGKSAFLKKLGRHIRAVCRSRGFSQDRLYLEGGFSRGTMSKIENGLVNVKVFTLKRIADTIGVPLAKLLDF
jgi:transcriptional regulator with XRE-family HTH domain